jgi:hypothetical protein
VKAHPVHRASGWCSGAGIVAWRKRKEESIHDPSCCICDACLRRRRLCPIPCKCPVSEPCLDRAGLLWSGIGARNSRGAISSAPERSPRSGTWGQYCASAVWRDAGSFNDAGNAVDIGIEFEITVEEMIELLGVLPKRKPFTKVSARPRRTMLPQRAFE